MTKQESKHIIDLLMEVQDLLFLPTSPSDYGGIIKMPTFDDAYRAQKLLDKLLTYCGG